LNGVIFKIDHNKASKLEVIEKQIEPKILPANFERNLAPNESEAGAELDEKLTQMFQEPSLQIALLCCSGEGQEIEVVRVLDELLRKIRLRFGKRRLEICDRFSLPPIKAALDLHNENVPAPSELAFAVEWHPHNLIGQICVPAGVPGDMDANGVSWERSFAASQSRPFSE
jgi:hypothetical protein